MEWFQVFFLFDISIWIRNIVSEWHFRIMGQELSSRHWSLEFVGWMEAYENLKRRQDGFDYMINKEQWRNFLGFTLVHTA